MKRPCPYCEEKLTSSEIQLSVKKSGRFRRKSDGRIVQKFQCLRCLKFYSNATGHPCVNQNKRQLNDRIERLLSSTVSMRRLARELRLSRTTVARKLKFLGEQARIANILENFSKPSASVVVFDDLETFEHSKCKPLSVTLVVEHPSRRIIGFKVSQMPAKGLLAAKALKKYGIRGDERTRGRDELFGQIKGFVHPMALIKSDENPHYVPAVREHFPFSNHESFKGQRGSHGGQGELKKVGYDPLFSLNHTCAMLRANICRLIRKTWCTTKNRERLSDHLAIYVKYHNLRLI